MDDFDVVLLDETAGEWRNDEFNSDDAWGYDPFGPDAEVWDSLEDEPNE